jgi:hypothetical protein
MKTTDLAGLPSDGRVMWPVLAMASNCGVGDDIRQFAEAQMGEFALFGFIRRQPAARTTAPNFSPLGSSFRMSFCPRCIPDIFHAAVRHRVPCRFHRLHFLRQGVGHIELNFFARFFQGHREVSGLAGQAGHHGIGPYADLGVIGLDP